MTQERYSEGPYDKDRPPYAAEDPHYHDDRPPYAAEGPYGHDDKEHSEHGPYEQHDTYSKRDHEGAVKGVCLQAFDFNTVDPGTVEIKLRCCEPQELPDVCLHNDTYGYKPHKKNWKRDDSGMFQDTALNPAYSARCTLTLLQDAFRATFAGPLCEVYDLSCTLNKHAAECGCPFEDGVSLQARLYAVDVNAKTCFNNPVDLKKKLHLRKALAGAKPAVATKMVEAGAKYIHNNATGGLVYDAVVGRYQGAIRFVDTPDGAVERKGTVEFIDEMKFVPTTPPTPVAGYPHDVPDLVNAHQMWIRFFDEEPTY